MRRRRWRPRGDSQSSSLLHWRPHPYHLGRSVESACLRVAAAESGTVTGDNRVVIKSITRVKSATITTTKTIARRGPNCRPSFNSIKRVRRSLGSYPVVACGRSSQHLVLDQQQQRWQRQQQQQHRTTSSGGPCSSSSSGCNPRPFS